MSDADFTLVWQDECAVFTLTRLAKRNAITLAIEDAREGVLAFLEKREPAFRHR